MRAGEIGFEGRTAGDTVRNTLEADVVARVITELEVRLRLFVGGAYVPWWSC